jgi:hypothetical protein
MKVLEKLRSKHSNGRLWLCGIASAVFSLGLIVKLHEAFQTGILSLGGKSGSKTIVKALEPIAFALWNIFGAFYSVVFLVMAVLFIWAALTPSSTRTTRRRVAR